MTKLPLRLALACSFIVALALFANCGAWNNNPISPSAPFSLSSSVASTRETTSRIGANAIDFPPRNEPLAFLDQLEIKYRDQLRSAASPTFVDHLGQAVWMSEYLRYRVNGCAHNDAVNNVFTVIDTNSRVTPPVCGSAASGVVQFPPRNEPVDFLDRLEVKYRDQLRAGSTSSFIDHLGNAVWTAEYLRYRVNNCSHADSVNNVFTVIDTNSRVIPPVCITVVAPPPAPTPIPPPTPTPTPTPQPTPTPGPNGPTCAASTVPSGVTAVCNDGSFSLSQNRSGTCSSHNGVRCWICPGPLCN